MPKRRMSFDTRKLTYIAMLTAIVMVLQYFGSFIKLGAQFSVTLVLVPVVMGAALCGVLSAGWLGLVFGACVLMYGDAAAFLVVNPLGTVVTVLLKGALAGLAAGLVYKLLEKINKYLAILVSAIVCPVVNTAVFILGSYLFFIPTITEWAGGGDAGVYIITVLVGANFLFELLFNILLAPSILRVLNLKKQ